MGPFSKILEPGPPKPSGLMLLVQYTECRNGAQTGQTGFTILCHYHYHSVTVGCLRDSLSVTESGGSPRLKLLCGLSRNKI